jgi:hypothetical protein
VSVNLTGRRKTRPESPRIEEELHPKLTIARAARNVFVASISGAVVAFLVFYALSRPEVKLETAFGSLDAHPGRIVVLHGRVRRADGDGVRGARLVLARSGAAQSVATTGAQGFYRVGVRGDCGPYEIDVAARDSGRTLGRHLHRYLCPGQELELSARVVSTGNFVWFPAR